MDRRHEILLKAKETTTQKALAERLGLAQSTISMMVHGNRRITERTLLHIARACPTIAQEIYDHLGYKPIEKEMPECHPN